MLPYSMASIFHPRLSEAQRWAKIQDVKWNALTNQERQDAHPMTKLFFVGYRDNYAIARQFFQFAYSNLQPLPDFWNLVIRLGMMYTFVREFLEGYSEEMKGELRTYTLIICILV